jgi:D-alanyl-D-alanine dipeptidase
MAAWSQNGQETAAEPRQGFVNYSNEWWHFSLPGAGREAYVS